ncbi:MAG TPA: ATP-binding cassette domain-containing protein, partial [Solirubrobacteraceae bacterium]|nr:ATP-binding cassette domain-containing protein [Solirubrobacteraceae bacterium]
MIARLRRWWSGATFGAARPGRRVVALAVLGTITGAGEALVVLLLVALVAGGESRLPGLVPAGGTFTLAAFALASVGVLAASHLAAARTAARAAADAQRRVQRLLVDAFLDASYEVQRRARAGELQEIVMGRAPQIAHGTAEAARAIATAANLLIVVVAAVVVDVRATLVLLVAVAFAIAIGRPFQARTRRIARENVEATASLATDVTETAGLAAELRVFHVTEPTRERLAGRLADTARLTEAIQLALTATPALTRDATLAVLVVGMAVLVSAASVPLAVLGAAVVLVMRALTHAQALATTLARLADRAANLEPVLHRLEEWQPRAAAGDRPCPRVGVVELEAVTFAHAGRDVDALRDVSLRLEPGEQLGIVGPTGAGKSTLAAVLLGLLRPDSGRVLVDGVPLEELAPADWYRRTAWVAQDPRLLTGSVRDNIRFLRPEIDDAAIARAARSAALTADLGGEEGLDRDAGPVGAALSGGQRQRVALARALAGDPSLVVLDEPT